MTFLTHTHFGAECQPKFYLGFGEPDKLGNHLFNVIKSFTPPHPPTQKKNIGEEMQPM